MDKRTGRWGALLAAAGMIVVWWAGQGWCLEVEEIVARANRVAHYAGNDGSTDVTMTIVDSQGRSRVREFRILRKNVTDGGEQKFYVYFRKPADVARMVYMVWKKTGASDDDRWLFLPALDLVRRVAASDKRSSFVGSHFVYEDVSGRSLEADVHELVDETETHYVVKNTPKPGREAEFSSYSVWIDKATFMPSKAEYYDAKGAVIRRIEALDVQEIDGHWTVVQSRATDLVRGGNTLMDFSNIRYDVGLTDDIFTERFLRTPPAQWIR